MLASIVAIVVAALFLLGVAVLVLFGLALGDLDAITPTPDGYK
jgi:hypothetical protein